MDARIATMIDEAVERTFTTIRRYAPALADRASAWAADLAVVGRAADYFTHIRAFPVLQIPFWLDASIGEAAEPQLHERLVYSSINGYYFIRIVDNIMDGHATIEASILPVAGIFHAEAMRAYVSMFSADHSFWEGYRQSWYGGAEFTVQDSAMADKSEAEFIAVAARKVDAAKIPLFAICHWRRRADLIAPWSEWIDVFGRWHLFEEDLFDWHVDLRDGVRTYFVCEAERRKQADESVEAWVLREGFSWGLAQLERWSADVERATAALDSPEATAYVAARRDNLASRAAKLTSGVSALTAALQTARG